MSKMPKSIKEVENNTAANETAEKAAEKAAEIAAEKTAAEEKAESKKDIVITEVIDVKDIKLPETEKKKLSFKDMFTLENIKKGLIWFFKSYIWLAIILFIGDMVTKYFANKYLTYGVSVTAIPHIFNWKLVYNPGAAWGGGGDQLWSRILLVIISWVAMIGIIYGFARYYKKLNGWYKASLMMVLAGDVGNLIDRTFFFNTRGVIDFIDIEPLFPWFNAIFNFADMCLVVGIIILMILMIIDMFKDGKKDKERAKKVEENIKNEREK